MFDGRVFYQRVCIPMSIDFAPPLADLFLCMYEANFNKGILKKQRKEASHVI